MRCTPTFLATWGGRNDAGPRRDADFPRLATANMLEQRDELIVEPLAVEVPLHRVVRGERNPHPPLVMIHEPPKCGGERVGVALGHEQSGYLVFHQLGNPAVPGRHYR